MKENPGGGHRELGTRPARANPAGLRPPEFWGFTTPKLAHGVFEGAFVRSI